MLFGQIFILVSDQTLIKSGHPGVRSKGFLIRFTPGLITRDRTEPEIELNIFTYWAVVLVLEVVSLLAFNSDENKRKRDRGWKANYDGLARFIFKI